jgi:hypothetical protein
MNKIKCKYCDFTIKSWYTAKDGHKYSGMTAMMHHFYESHKPTYDLQREAVERALDALEDERYDQTIS